MHFANTSDATCVAAIVKNKLHRQAATLTEYKQKVVELQKKLIEVEHHIPNRQFIDTVSTDVMAQ